MAARERQITVTLRRRTWAEFERRRIKALAEGVPTRGIDSEVINDLIEEHMTMLLLRSAGASAPPAASDDDDFVIVLPSQASE